jgi:hypothetical protein
VLLWTGSNLCLWLRQCIDARNFEAARNIEPRSTSGRLDHVENVSKSQILLY